MDTRKRSHNKKPRYSLRHEHIVEALKALGAVGEANQVNKERVVNWLGRHGHKTAIRPLKYVISANRNAERIRNRDIVLFGPRGIYLMSSDPTQAALELASYRTALEEMTAPLLDQLTAVDSVLDDLESGR